MPETVTRQAPAGDDFLSPDELKTLTPKDVIARTRALRDRLRAAATEAEARRRPDDALWSELRRSGFFYMLIPKKLGGLVAGGRLTQRALDGGLRLAKHFGEHERRRGPRWRQQ
jgi:alkylation response protein AidB-like acyl-CoA dehydrogenase